MPAASHHSSPSTSDEEVEASTPQKRQVLPPKPVSLDVLERRIARLQEQNERQAEELKQHKVSESRRRKSSRPADPLDDEFGSIEADDDEDDEELEAASTIRTSSKPSSRATSTSSNPRTTASRDPNWKPLLGEPIAVRDLSKFKDEFQRIGGALLAKRQMWLCKDEDFWARPPPRAGWELNAPERMDSEKALLDWMWFDIYNETPSRFRPFLGHSDMYRSIIKGNDDARKHILDKFREAIAFAYGLKPHMLKAKFDPSDAPEIQALMVWPEEKDDGIKTKEERARDAALKEIFPPFCFPPQVRSDGTVARVLDMAKVFSKEDELPIILKGALYCTGNGISPRPACYGELWKVKDTHLPSMAWVTASTRFILSKDDAFYATGKKTGTSYRDDYNHTVDYLNRLKKDSPLVLHRLLRMWNKSAYAAGPEADEQEVEAEAKVSKTTMKSKALRATVRDMMGLTLGDSEGGDAGGARRRVQQEDEALEYGSTEMIATPTTPTAVRTTAPTAVKTVTPTAVRTTMPTATAAAVAPIRAGVTGTTALTLLARIEASPPQAQAEMQMQIAASAATSLSALTDLTEDSSSVVLPAPPAKKGAVVRGAAKAKAKAKAKVTKAAAATDEDSMEAPAQRKTRAHTSNK
ncbi:hypothetical protein BDN72DRAFT_906866 [Pluteus cervinus]|uniref:Uncharacterized protein n=1 Tax=Pluteus cervinus TaxID=181527 RepID=A0ACD2ZXY5_9AGAR|nr:hypothetical protein BDN72DRAFT_906866 [Pluteus cervinus]